MKSWRVMSAALIVGFFSYGLSLGVIELNHRRFPFCMNRRSSCITKDRLVTLSIKISSRTHYVNSSRERAPACLNCHSKLKTDRRPHPTTEPQNEFACSKGR